MSGSTDSMVASASQKTEWSSTISTRIGNGLFSFGGNGLLASRLGGLRQG
jgi:hypothetical protein